MVEFKCKRCGEDFARKGNLTRHKKRKYPCGDTVDRDVCEAAPRQRKRISEEYDFNEETSQSDDDDIPTFDGDEFCGNKPKSRETLNKMMKLLKVPEHRWDKIGTSILNEVYL